MKSSRILITALVLLGAVIVSACSGGNYKPVFFPIMDKETETGKTLEFDVKAYDDNNDALSISMQFAEEAPEGVVFQDLGTGTASFAWTPLASDAGNEGSYKNWVVTFHVSDGAASNSETITIRVVLGNAGVGAPVFITPSDHTLDLGRKDQIKFNIEIRDADSANVEIRQVDPIPGSDFQSTAGSKIAAFRWRPTADQIAERPVWSFRVSADDHENPKVIQDITMLIKGRSEEQQKCEGTSPKVEHEALPDQRGPVDYPVSVTATDEESEITAVSLYWKIDKGEDDASTFEKLGMTSGGGNLWQASIPNAGLEGETTATVTYYICAVDDDDAEGADCDKRTCMPDEDRFAFTAYAPGNNQCLDDEFEANDSSTEPTEVMFDQTGECYYEMRKICPANEDWYRVTVPAGHEMGALLGYTDNNGQIEMDLYDADGSTMLLAGEKSDNLVALFPEASPQEVVYYFRVRGANAMVENSYDMYVVAETYEACSLDTLEPNDGPDDAAEVTEWEYIGLNTCEGIDWYKIDLAQGDTLDVLLEFSQEDGDLDLAVFDPAVVWMENLSFEHAMASATSETDDEELSVTIPVDNTYYVVVAPYEEARADYTMTILVTPFAGCTEDDKEPNNTPEDAEGVWPVRYDDMTICPDDVDWFFMYANAGETFVIDVYFTHAEGDLDVVLYDAGVVGGDPIAHELDGGVSSDDNEHVEYAVTEAGDYYFAITGYQGSSNTYAFEVSTR